MAIADILLTIILLFAVGIITKGQIISYDFMITLAFVLIVGAALVDIYLRDHIPLFNLKNSYLNVFAEDQNIQKMYAAIEQFFAKNKLRTVDYEGYLMKSRMEMYEGHFTDSIDTLLYIDPRDTDQKIKAKISLLRLKNQMFMDQLKLPNNDYKLVLKNQNYLDQLDIFDANLIKGYHRMINGKLDKARESAEILKKQFEKITNNQNTYRNELRWFQSLLSLKSADQSSYLSSYNLLKHNKALPYLMLSLERNNPEAIKKEEEGICG